MSTKPLLRSIVIVCAVLSPFILATEPVPPPYHQFVLDGTVVRASNGPRTNFIVTLAGRFNGFSSDSTGDLARYYSYTQENRTQSITDSNGTFSLQVNLTQKPDSLAIRVEAPDKPVYLGSYFKTPDADATITEAFDESEPGCSGCSRNPVSTTQIVGYRHTIQPQMISLPY
jgi:hypothetical protein